MKKILWIFVLCLLFNVNAYSLPKCDGEDSKKWTNCEGVFNYPDKKYSGEWKDGKREGRGISILNDGTKYVGEWKNDKPNGQGSTTSTYNYFSIKFVGQWKDGKPNGQGTLKCLPVGRKKTGEWDAKTYTGEWKDGLLKIKIENGNEAFVQSEFCGIYEGELKDGSANGQGTQTYPDGTKYVGEWKNDVPNGLGTQTFGDGKKYVGEWKNGKPNGQGTFTWKNGDKYIGQLKDGKLHGKGVYTFQDGKILNGVFKDGEFIEEI